MTLDSLSRFFRRWSPILLILSIWTLFLNHKSLELTMGNTLCVLIFFRWTMEWYKERITK